MATLAGQRAQFTWALNQYNLAENAEKQALYAQRMAKYIAAAPANGFTVDQVTQEAVDTSDVVRLGDGQSVVYADGYRCAPDRLKAG